MEKILGTLQMRLVAANVYEDFINDFKKLTTDESRIMFTLIIMLKFKIPIPVCGDVKNTKESEKLREQGNKIFVSTPLKSSTCIEALKLYTKSIAYAPYSSKQLALAYSNRSAVLIKVHKHEECIQDIERALALAYPDNLKAKLYIRKAECLRALKKFNEDTIKEAQLWLEKMTLNDTDKKKLNNKLISIKSSDSASRNSKKQNMRHKAKPPLPTLESHNPEVPCISDAIAIRYNERYGRHVVATRKIKPGEIIAIEKPYSLILTPTNVYTHCSQCLEVCWANIPCDYCVHAMYCSEECKAIAWKKYHDVECAVFPSLISLDFVKLDLFSLRLAVQFVRESNSIQELREEIEEVDNCKDPRTKGFSKNGILESDKYRSILGLVTNTEKRSVADLFGRCLDSCFILYYLATKTNMFGSPLSTDLSALLKNSDVTFVGGLILRHQQVVPSNIHSFSEECGLEAVQRGLAAMSFFSLVNHSCNPNILRHSREGHIIMYAMYPIENGEQIFDNYGQHYAMTPKPERQKELLKQYYFKCECIPCTENWPLFYDLQSFRSLLKSGADENKINRALRKFNDYVNIATDGNVTDKPYIIDDLLRMIQVLYDNVQMPNDEINNVVETLKRVYDLNGNRFEMPEL